MHTENIEATKNATRDWDGYKGHIYKMFYQMSQQLIAHFKPTEISKFSLTREHFTSKDLVSFFSVLHMSAEQWKMEEIFKKKFVERSSTFKLAQEDVTEMNAKIGELREIVSTSDFLHKKHRRSLLLRLEKFQSEVHKAVSDFDVFLAGWSEVNEMIEDTGKKSKPIVDRFTELLGIAKRNKPKLLDQDDEPKQITDQSDSIDDDE